ncbi:hypothetical protein O181_111006 [Austropuccinia psidii MF-1]|uniref:Required for respiratory growth protein 9, mitochondrial n=1 Tax=Austropuccinia psidii MF-1 TaxID=1389203 RepID=A0A9Q3JZP6_9BASI|nr:hypothetical protein [Austropuccinia psidii MF-1]
MSHSQIRRHFLQTIISRNFSNQQRLGSTLKTSSSKSNGAISGSGPPAQTSSNGSKSIPTASYDKPDWLIQKEALKEIFPEGWNPPKKISRPAMKLLRTLHQTDPQQFSLPALSDKFKISPEAVRRILRSKWEPDQTAMEKLERRAKKTTGGNADGWVHYEKVETEQIPVNLAETLKASLQNPVQSTSRQGKQARWETGDRDNRLRDISNKSTSNHFEQEAGSTLSTRRFASDKLALKDQSRSQTRIKLDSKLGSAFASLPS